MKKITISDFEAAIKAKYAVAREGEYQEFLDEPTPAGLKRLCLLVLNNISPADLGIYKRFFFLKEDKDVYDQINNFETVKFRALQNFLIGGSETSSEERLNLLAILVDLQPRPYQKFRKQESRTDNGDAETETEKTGEGKIQPFYSKANRDVSRADDIEGMSDKTDGKLLEHAAFNADGSKPSIPEVTVVPQKYFAVGRNQKLSSRYNLIKIIVIGVLFFTVVAFAFKNLFMDSGGCMVWKDDHYEIVPCNNDVNTLIDNPTVPLSEDLLNYQKKVAISDTTIFYNPDGSPRIWYGKSAKKEYEFFTYPGLHPETHKTLKKITDYIIKKYTRK